MPEWVKESKWLWFGYINDELAYEVGYDRECGWHYIDLPYECGTEGYGTAMEAKRAAAKDAKRWHHIAKAA